MKSKNIISVMFIVVLCVSLFIGCDQAKDVYVNNTSSDSNIIIAEKNQETKENKEFVTAEELVNNIIPTFSKNTESYIVDTNIDYKFKIKSGEDIICFNILGELNYEKEGEIRHSTEKYDWGMWGEGQEEENQYFVDNRSWNDNQKVYTYNQAHKKWIVEDVSDFDNGIVIDSKYISAEYFDNLNLKPYEKEDKNYIVEGIFDLGKIISAELEANPDSDLFYFGANEEIYNVIMLFDKETKILKNFKMDMIIQEIAPEKADDFSMIFEKYSAEYEIHSINENLNLSIPFDVIENAVKETDLPDRTLYEIFGMFPKEE